ncbi:XRE family transcriptional regulator [Pseudoalteromonas sp. MMG005]|uniref:XRE family transcriptional regulator n=1 Tax=Pseudoalteromonas sp. MMG005 TaxID=2822682 RepID=UPI001B3A7512|nr:XRE family transcriptional regulator [Pseudoalteromonas sp. MMG005]MBQ4848096.1 LexA family transcriptional regulator [Pseudoalteromonas sp. MMG005]
MSSAFSHRFNELVLQFSGGNKRHFAELTGKSQSHIYRICRGLSRPSMAYLEHLYELFKIDLNWLLTGQYSIEQHPNNQSPDLLMVPKFDIEASAGFGSVNNSEDITEQFALNKHWLSTQLGVYGEQLAFVSIRGDSMLPTLHHDDMVLVDLSHQTPHQEGIYIIQTSDGLMAKRLKQGKQHIDVISDNHDYPNWKIDHSNAEQHGIAGKIVWCGRSI